MPESFFDFRSRITKPPAEADDGRLERAISVGDLTARIDAAIRGGVGGSVLVRGEISNLNAHAASGHLYFTLKDDKSCIDCVMFRGEASKLRQRPTDGQDVLISGSVRVYVQRGRYQLYCNTLTPLGRGALELKFNELQRKLEAEGLFAAEIKRPIPPYPQRIVLITSRQAAALQDMLKVFQRTPWLTPRVIHVPVQGVGAAAKIADALASVSPRDCDLVLLGRGGGSLEDLWEFNEEAVARAIRACRVPVMTGIGHEVDVSIADLAADYHAHTPTEAAQVAVARWRLAADALDGAAGRLTRSLRQTILHARQRLTNVERHETFRRPTDRIDRLRQVLDDRQRQLRAAALGTINRVRQRLTRHEHRLHAQHPTAGLLRARQRLTTAADGLAHQQRLRLTQAAGRLDGLRRELAALDPRGVLARGYSITRLKNGKPVFGPADVKAGDVLVTQVRDGTIESTARDAKQLDLF
ncbi:MAG TPA: exodeoxyribonuclease VII large subunit [Tepidisphaeraceae bacterium]|jgi:exodeoxyribonuclease VII large subunit